MLRDDSSDVRRPQCSQPHIFSPVRTGRSDPIDRGPEYPPHQQLYTDDMEAVRLTTQIKQVNAEKRALEQSELDARRQLDSLKAPGAPARPHNLMPGVY
jgi:hypothetical protein